MVSAQASVKASRMTLLVRRRLLDPGYRLGSREASSSTGLVLNNALHSFTARDPNRYLGHAGVSLNHPRPGKRPLSPLAPCVVLDGDRNLMAAVAASELFQVPQYSATVSNGPFLSIDKQRTIEDNF